MLNRVWRLWLWVAILVLVAVLTVPAIAGVFLVRSSFPATQGLVTVAGLQAPVDVYRSSAGVPHIIASNEHDLFFAQGYVHAQDRFYQMDFFRHVGTGTTSEMFGRDAAATDAFLQTLGWERLAQEEAAQLDPDSRAILQAYSDGVNAYLAERDGASLSLEYAILALSNPAYSVEPWSVAHSLAWAKSMAWDLGGNLDGEIDRTLLLQSLTLDQLDDLYPPYPEDHPVIVPGAGGNIAGLNQRPGRLPAAAMPALEELHARIGDLPGLLPPGQTGLGSNNWVISGEYTASGGALLANDTHLGIQLPSIWYENGLHCRSLTPACRYRVAGFSFAAAPGVVIGHNERIAWGATNVGPDVQDLYIESLHPEDGDRYQRDGEWVEMEIREAEVVVAAGETLPLTVRFTVHGPIISGTYGRLDELDDLAKEDLPAKYAISLAWTALEPSTVVRSILELNRARDFDGFRAALRHFDVPAQNFVYADIEGNIGYQMVGAIPIRQAGDGWLPSPGWDSSYDWVGYVDFDQLPWLYNPLSGYIVTANNAVVDESYPYLISRQWDYGYRAQRIASLIESAPQLDAEAMTRIQGDNQNAMTDILLPYLADLEFEDPIQREWVGRLVRWDGQNDVRSAEAALFNTLWAQLVNRTFFEDWEAGPLPQDSRAFEVMRRLLAQPESDWWDLSSTPEVESRDDLLQTAYLDSFATLQQRLGNDPQDWQWGELHTATFRNQSLGISGVGPVEALLNRGPFPVGGGSSIVNATNWDLTEGPAVTSLPSQRFIIDLSKMNSAQTIHTPGQSGHAFHSNYIDLAQPWSEIQFHQLDWDIEAIIGDAAFHLRLAPP
jgi:penicillin amidase